MVDEKPIISPPSLGNPPKLSALPVGTIQPNPASTDGIYDRDPDPDHNSVSMESLAAMIAATFGPTLDQSVGRPFFSRNSRSAVSLLDYMPHGSAYSSLRYTSGIVNDNGVAFSVNKAIDSLEKNCTETYGKCRAHVLDAIDQKGEIREALMRGGYDVGAKHISDVLLGDPKLNSQFSLVGSGYGASLSDSAMKPYEAQAGDICVWEGGEWGHVMMCIGHRANGSPIWRADYTAREGNWTGLQNPDSFGAFHIFRQRSLETPANSEIKLAQQPMAEPVKAKVLGPSVPTAP
jgi:hypothetical protein